jgi:hypothetical protein
MNGVKNTNRKRKLVVQQQNRVRQEVLLKFQGNSSSGDFWKLGIHSGHDEIAAVIFSAEVTLFLAVTLPLLLLMSSRFHQEFHSQM